MSNLQCHVTLVPTLGKDPLMFHLPTTDVTMTQNTRRLSSDVRKPDNLMEMDYNNKPHMDKTRQLESDGMLLQQ